MNRKEYEVLKRQAENKFQAAKAEFEADVAAIDRVWRISQGNGVVKTDPVNDNPAWLQPNAVTNGDSRDAKKGEVADAVASVLPVDSRIFNWKDIDQGLSQQHPNVPRNRTTISQILRRFEEDGTLAIAEQGKGRRATKYTRVQQETKEPAEAGS